MKEISQGFFLPFFAVSIEVTGFSTTLGWIEYSPSVSYISNIDTSFIVTLEMIPTTIGLDTKSELKMNSMQRNTNKLTTDTLYDNKFACGRIRPTQQKTLQH